MNNSKRLSIILTIGIVFEVLLIVVGLAALIVQSNTSDEAAVYAEDTSVFPVPGVAVAELPPSPRPTGVYLPAPLLGPTTPPVLAFPPAPLPSPPAPSLPLPSPAVLLPPTPAPTPFPVTATPRPVLAPSPTLVAYAGPLPELADVPVFLYHYVEELPADADQIRQNLTVSPAEFAAQLQYLADNGYHTITLENLYHYLFEGRSLPEKPVILTFDDGYRDAYDVAFPLLKRYGFVGTFFIFTAPVEEDNPTYLTWGMIEEMSWSGMEIASHGRDHVGMADLPYDTLVAEMYNSRLEIESHLGRPIHFFCYPYGSYDTPAISVLESSGYWGAVTTYPNRYHVRGGLFQIGRYRMGPGMWAGGLAALLGQ